VDYQAFCARALRRVDLPGMISYCQQCPSWAIGKVENNPAIRRRARRPRTSNKVFQVLSPPAASNIITFRLRRSTRSVCWPCSDQRISKDGVIIIKGPVAYAHPGGGNRRKRCEIHSRLQELNQWCRCSCRNAAARPNPPKRLTNPAGWIARPARASRNRCGAG